MQRKKEDAGILTIPNKRFGGKRGHLAVFASNLTSNFE
jgi:hypothetical protein